MLLSTSFGMSSEDVDESNTHLAVLALNFDDVSVVAVLAAARRG